MREDSLRGSKTVGKEYKRKVKMKQEEKIYLREKGCGIFDI